MSRIDRERLEPGDTLTATDLNNRYNDYSQTGTIDADNTRDGAVDVPHIPSDATLINALHSSINGRDIYHGGFGIVAMTLTGAPTPVEAGRVSFGASGWTFSAVDILRVYGSLQCNAFIENDPNTAAPNDAMFTVPPTVGTTAVNISMGTHVWIVQLEWNITDPALATGWVPVPGGNDFQSQFVTGRYGSAVSTLQGCAMTQAYWSGAENWRPGGKADGGTNTIFKRSGWKNVPVTWSGFPGTATVYGLRLVVHGVYHPINSASVNGLVLDYNFATWGASQPNPPEFYFSSGSLTAIQLRSV